MDIATPAWPPEPICGICGELHKSVECSIVGIKRHIPDKIIPSKARLTFPECVGIETMADGTYCVLANTCIEKGTQFGPLEAQKLLTLHPSIVFPVKLFNCGAEDLSEYYLDTCDENSCNWMIFVTPAQNIEEQNLICFQEKSKIFYVTTKDIQAGEFLRVWYSPYYAKKMKQNVLTSRNLPEFYEPSSDIIQPIDLNKLLKKQQKIMERDSWTCKFCGKLENDVTLFATHILEHYSKRLKKHCDICKQSFSNLKSLRRHTKSVHMKDDTAKKCKLKEALPEKAKPKDTIVGGPLLNDLLNDSSDNTNLVLPSIELNQIGITLTNSMENQNILLEGDSLSLNVDNLLTENVKELDHFNFEIGESQEQYVCDVCLKVFTKLPYLLQHLKKHTGKFTCHHCLKIFCRSENLKAHKCTDNKEPQYTCSLCQRGFMLRKYLLRHMNAIHDKKYTCENCSKKYHSNKEYREHNCSAIPDNHKETFACVTCNKEFFREVYLRKHLRTHLHREQQKILPKHLICEVCAQRFSTRKGLQLHMNIHLERTLVCEVCNKKFYRQDVLNNHMATHGDAKVTCTVCNTKLKTKQTLAVHMLQHTGVKPHRCDMCSQAFHQRSTLMKHAKTHLKVCYLCNKRFATDELLERHKAEHAVKEVFICPLCNKGVKLRSSLRRHLKQFHAEVDTNTIMSDVKPKEVSFKQDAAKCDVNLFNNNVVDEINMVLSSEFCINNEINTGLDTNAIETENFENIVENFENIIGSYGSSDAASLVLGSYENADEKSGEKRSLDFNDLEMDLDTNFDVQQNLNMNNQEVCLSMPDLMELDQEITLGENAYILDNGTIVEPKDKGNVLVYILDKHF